MVDCRFCCSPPFFLLRLWHPLRINAFSLFFVSSCLTLETCSLDLREDNFRLLFFHFIFLIFYMTLFKSVPAIINGQILPCCLNITFCSCCFILCTWVFLLMQEDFRAHSDFI